MKITAEQFVESLARLSDEEKQKAANLLVSKWKYLTKIFMGLMNLVLNLHPFLDMCNICQDFVTFG